jgi:hypothetical protein
MTRLSQSLIIMQVQLTSVLQGMAYISQSLIFVFTFLYLSIMVLKCCNECPQEYKATSLRALRLHQNHCEAAQQQHTQSTQTRKMGLSKERRQLTSLRRLGSNKATISHPAADSEVRIFLPLFNQPN